MGIDDAITMKGRVSAAVWESEMLCLRPRRTESVYPEFDPRVHVAEATPWDHGDRSPVRWVAGMDLGYRSPTVVLWGAADPEGTLYIVDERIVAEATLRAHIAAIHASPYPKPEWIGIDPAANQVDPQTGRNARQVMAEAGLRTLSRRTDLRVGLGLVRARLGPASGPPRLLVHRRCKGLIEALEKYHYDAGRPECDDPVKDGPDHAADALRYLVANLDAGWEAKVGNYAR